MQLRDMTVGKVLKVHSVDRGNERKVARIHERGFSVTILHKELAPTSKGYKWITTAHKEIPYDR